MEFTYRIGEKGFELHRDNDPLVEQRFVIDVELVEDQVHLAFIGPYVDGHIIVTKDDTDLDFQIKSEIQLPDGINPQVVIGGVCLLLQREDELLVQKISDFTVNDLSLEFPLAFSDAKKICYDRDLTPIHDNDTLKTTHPIYLNETMVFDEGMVLNSHRIEGFFHNREIYLKLIDDVTGVEIVLPSKFIALNR